MDVRTILRSLRVWRWNLVWHRERGVSSVSLRIPRPEDVQCSAIVRTNNGCMATTRVYLRTGLAKARGDVPAVGDVEGC